MRKWISISCPLIMTFILVSFGFKNKPVLVPDSLKVNTPTLVSFPQDETFNAKFLLTPPYIGSSYVGFKEALAFKESRGRYGVINSLGYLGKYQFGASTLELVGIYNVDLFLSNPELQEKAFMTNIARNKWILRRDIERFSGIKIGNSQVTESGIIAAAHLAGPGNVKKYLRSYGAYDVFDDYGTNIARYIKLFSGYDISNVEPKRNARILK
ncbi:MULTISPECIES: lytic transglycosylase domain-containing protein [Cellulophaga]|uniref:Peptidoglycan-binding protein LysM n=1 Tax=Cellulophaga baltica TaxID=76594 RepID=A0A1G7FZB8_9FLAO|nr:MULTISPECIES: lytic transglycosylase domain-containing protein [Cellulophaga]QXP53470.1 lytic transglycosylase domain-containing protein [Cellulophaga sp. HaHa_2_1]QXP57922.1 lytic transglycosylase domain-containing protein [Cellulophaga sp. HaHa_2_95]SDE81224.1 hypothetical protein SAMN04487992_10414 [Cellulophaga baltica]